MDVSEELKLLWKCKKNRGGGRSGQAGDGGGGGRVVGVGRKGGDWLVAMLGVGGDVGMGDVNQE